MPIDCKVALSAEPAAKDTKLSGQDGFGKQQLRGHVMTNALKLCQMAKFVCQDLKPDPGTLDLDVECFVLSLNVPRHKLQEFQLMYQDQASWHEGTPLGDEFPTSEFVQPYSRKFGLRAHVEQSSKLSYMGTIPISSFLEEHTGCLSPNARWMLEAASKGFKADPWVG